MPKRFFCVLIALALFSTLLGACAGNTATQAESGPLVVGWSLYPGWYPLVIAQEQGLFEKHGVEVELVLYETYGDIAPGLSSGLVDAAALVLGDVLLEDVGNSSTVVLITDNSFGADQLIASPALMESKDLRGARVGVTTGTFGELLVREMLTKYDLKFSDISLVEVSPEQVADAIPGVIDIGHTFEPFASQAREKGNGIFFSSADAPGIIVDTIAFRNTVLRDRPEDVRNFIDAWFEAVEFWQANPEQGNAIIAQATGQDVKDVSAEGVLFFDRAANLAAFQPGTDTTSLVFTARMEMDFLIATGIVTEPVDIQKILDASYLQRSQP